MTATFLRLTLESSHQTWTRVERENRGKPGTFAGKAKGEAGNPFAGQPEHSAEHFGDPRDHWWNPDFLHLLAQRFRLDAVRDVLDVGCGVGHWGQLLASVLPENARVTGVDREAKWVRVAGERAAARRLAARFTYLQGDARHLAFPDHSFDFTTCQTLLIHLDDPRAAVAEMLRVTRPGGLVVVAEPNNLTETLLLDSVSATAPVDDVVDLVRLQLTCERGKVALGEGDNSLGDRVPGIFAAAGLEQVEVYVNDRAIAVFPPYSREHQRAFVEDARQRLARRLWNWDEAEARRFFLAGGGRESDFTPLFEKALTARARILRGVSDHTYHGVVGGDFFVVSGRKPPDVRAR